MIKIYGTKFFRGQITLNGKTHVLVGENYQETYCNTTSKDDRFYNDAELTVKDFEENITCKKCLKAFVLDYTEYLMGRRAAN